MGRPRKADDEAVDLAESLLSRRYSKAFIKSQLKEKFDCCARTCERVLSRARERIIAASGADRTAHRQDALAFYNSIIRDDKANVREKIIAQERIDKLLGLEAAAKIELQPNIENEEKRQIEAAILHDPQTNALAESLAIRLARNARVNGGDAG